jgi:ATP-dependent RNA helicase DOB1
MCVHFQEVEKRFPDGLPVLDPIEDMRIKEKSLHDVIKVGRIVLSK